jgi:hypothetical protein
MKYAFDNAGYDLLRLELKTVAQRFSREDWIAIYDEAVGSGRHPNVRQDQACFVAPASEPMAGEGQSRSAQQDQEHLADARQPLASGEGPSAHVQQDPATLASPAREPDSPIPDGGQFDAAQQGQSGAASARNLIASGTGQQLRVQQDQRSSAPPAREPRGPSEAYLRAAAKSRLETARTMLYLHKTNDGRWYGDVYVYEFPQMERDAKFAEAFKKVFGPFSAKQERMKCGELLNAEQQERVWKLANG